MTNQIQTQPHSSSGQTTESKHTHTLIDTSPLRPYNVYMSLFTDIKYLNQIGNRLSLFKRKGDYLYNCRCHICGDSQTKKNKARGYFYRANNDLFYKCHNCDASQHFGTFLKKVRNIAKDKTRDNLQKDL